jgi:hypothetical protein
MDPGFAKNARREQAARMDVKTAQASSKSLRSLPCAGWYFVEVHGVTCALSRAAPTQTRLGDIWRRESCDENEMSLSFRANQWGEFGEECDGGRAFSPQELQDAVSSKFTRVKDTPQDTWLGEGNLMIGGERYLDEVHSRHEVVGDFLLVANKELTN